MNFRDLSCQEWDSLGSEEMVKLSKRLAASLPQAIKYTGLRSYQLGTVSHSVAEFEFDSARFVLVPGGSPNLGYDAQRFLPTIEQLDSFNSTAKKYRIQEDLQSFIRRKRPRPCRSSRRAANPVDTSAHRQIRRDSSRS
jgi:hypothetical protein